MACFITPAATAAATKKWGKKAISEAHINWLQALLWGSTGSLVVSHVMTGDLIPSSASDALKDMFTTGLFVTLFCILLWSLALGVERLYKKYFHKA